MTSKQNKSDASEWQSCAAELGTGSLFDGDGTPTPACDNVLLEWAAALELYARGQVKAVMPVSPHSRQFQNEPER